MEKDIDKTRAEEMLERARAQQNVEMNIKEEDGFAKEAREALRNRTLHEEETEREPDIQKVYIKNYGNLMLEIIGTNDIGLSARSEKRKEDLFIPWTSIIMCSKVEGE